MARTIPRDPSVPPPPAPPKAPLTPPPVVRANDNDKGSFYHGSSFKQIGATAEVIAALQTLGITKPSHVQAESYRLLNTNSERGHVAITDQAGSGKTLAYLLPLMQQLRLEEQRALKASGPAGSSSESLQSEASKSPSHPPSASLARKRSARLIVLAPTTELAQQVYRVVKALSAAGLKCRSALMTGGEEDPRKRSKSFRTQAEQMEGGLDLLVSTPGRLLAHLDANNISLRDGCNAVVLDEVDVLLGDQAAFKEQVVPLKEAAPKSLRFVLVTATLPAHTLDQFKNLFDEIAIAMGPGLHRTAVGLEEELIDCSGGDEISLEAGTARKLEAMSQALDRRGSARTLIFCNKIETCRAVENHLRRTDKQSKGKVIVYHEAIREEVRVESLNSFLQPVKAGEAPTILVATDRMSRGIDSMYCEHVILFDFPRDPSEYVRRVGRTARGAGGRGLVSVLVLGRQVQLAKDIIDRNQKGQPLHRLPQTE